MRIKTIPSLFVVIAFSFCCENGDTVGGTGQGGSMTRFAISGNHLYVLEPASLRVFSIVDGVFEPLSTVDLDFGMETIFANGDFLYIGAMNAMYIYSLADPAKPSFAFRYQHIVSCDPVIVQGARAYVTLRSGTARNRGVNALEIIDISNPYAPVLVHSYPMSSPHGLGIDGNLLFLCDGPQGLKVFDVTNEHDLKLVKRYDKFFAYDVIARQGIATVTGTDGIFQFSYDHSEEQIRLLSTIPVTRTNL